MAPDHTELGIPVNPIISHSVEFRRYRIRMEARDSKKTLWVAVSSLMKRDYGGENLTRLGKAVKSPATSARLKEQKTSIGVTMLDRLATHFKVEPWQMLVPGFDAKNPPELKMGDSDQVLPSIAGSATGTNNALHHLLETMSELLKGTDPAALRTIHDMIGSMLREPDRAADLAKHAQQLFDADKERQAKAAARESTSSRPGKRTG